ncbi:two-component response regulator [Pseudomonas aeruginosa]|nr:two-component response regulator [Pseudomonas aeruginosa]
MEQEAWRILIVEDDRRLAELTREYLEGNGLKVDIEANGALAAARILAERPDLVVLDLMLPGEDGLSICRQVRPQFDGPILMLTARTDDMDEVLGLEMGADDYVCKPVRPRVLLARIRALLRRSEAPEAGAPAADSKRLAFGRLVIDNAMREAWLDGTTIELTSAEFDLLWLLAANAGRILSREEIFNALRGIEYDGQDRSIDVRISRIRPEDRRRPDAPAADQDRAQQGLPVRRRGLRRFFPAAGARASRSARINSSGQRPGARR